MSDTRTLTATAAWWLLLLALAMGGVAGGAIRAWSETDKVSAAIWLAGDPFVQVGVATYAAFKIVSGIAKSLTGPDDIYADAFATVTRWFEAPFLVTAGAYALGLAAASGAEGRTFWIALLLVCALLAIATAAVHRRTSDAQPPAAEQNVASTGPDD